MASFDLREQIAAVKGQRAGSESQVRGGLLCMRDPLPPAQLGDRVLASQARQDNPDLVLGRVLLPRCAADGLYVLFGRLRRPGILSHHRSLNGLRLARIPPIAKTLNLSQSC
jgi:hypothetical protein